MFIEVYRSKQRLTKNLIQQMPRGYAVMCGPFIVIGYVAGAIKGEALTGIIQSGEEYFTLPLDYELGSDGVSCRRVAGCKVVEYRFMDTGSVECVSMWWNNYVSFKEKALSRHIYIL